MSSCKLFETLSKCHTELEDNYNPKEYNCSETCPHYGKCFYKCKCPPEDKNLQGFFGGWQKYCVISFSGHKDVFLKNTNNPVINILHLISPAKVDDIVIFRLVKKNKKGEYQIRYLCKQGHKDHLCSNIEELNMFIDNRYEYVGRKLTKEDFVNV